MVDADHGLLWLLKFVRRLIAQHLAGGNIRVRHNDDSDNVVVAVADVYTQRFKSYPTAVECVARTLFCN